MISPRRDPTFTPRRALALFLVLFVAGVLRGSELAEKGIGHSYYAATVYSMTQSPSNWWFAAAEPGGSITVDKPPLGFMLQAASASVFGYNMVALALPQLAAGMLSIAVMHALIGRRFGFWAGIVAASLLAATPVLVLADRTNLVDSTLSLTQLIAVGFGLRAAETGRLRPLLLAVVALGLGFNIKMAQAVFAGPGIVLAYLLAAPVSWRKRFAHLAAAGAVLAVVALLWVFTVAATPPEQRPWIGSTANNSIMELMVEYNLTMRATGVSTSRNSTAVVNAALMRLFDDPLRTFTDELYYAAGFYLPLALAAAAGLALTWRPRKRLTEPYLSLLVWGLWLAFGVVAISAAGFIHVYYAIVYVVPAAAVIGITAGTIAARRRLWPAVLWLAACALLAAYQAAVPAQDGTPPLWWPLAAGLLAAGVVLLALRRPRAVVAAGAGAILVAPLLFSALTSQMALNRMIPEPYGGQAAAAWQRNPDAERLDYNPAALDYLLQRTQDVEYLVATPTAIIGAPYVVHGRRPVLYLGGFAGNDMHVPLERLEQMIAEGRLRYVFLPISFDAQRPEFREWVSESCGLVFGVDLMPPRVVVQDGQRVYQNQPQRDIDSLFDCRPA